MFRAPLLVDSITAQNNTFEAPARGPLFLEATILAKAKNTDLEDIIEISTEMAAETEPISEEPRAREQEKPPRLVYVGPNVPDGILQRFQVFKGGFPPHCKDLFKEIPEIKELFVSIEDLETMRKKIDDPGTNEARLFYLVRKKLTKGVK
jgi:hypothetical protein